MMLEAFSGGPTPNRDTGQASRTGPDAVRSDPSTSRAGQRGGPPQGFVAHISDALRNAAEAPAATTPEGESDRQDKGETRQTEPGPGHPQPSPETGRPAMVAEPPEPPSTQASSAHASSVLVSTGQDRADPGPGKAEAADLPASPSTDDPVTAPGTPTPRARALVSGNARALDPGLAAPSADPPHWQAGSTTGSGTPDSSAVQGHPAQGNTAHSGVAFSAALAGLPLLPTPAAGPTAALPAALPAPAPTHVVSIGTPVADPAFPGQLAGDALSLAIAGIEHAEISLRPRDMGPIRIELSLNGESARIAFAAAHPETRQAIERSLPILADMLAAHSLQLDGASVSDHPARHGQPDRDPARTPSERHDDRGGGGDPTAADAVDPAAGPRPARLAVRGLLDLYA